MLGDVVWSNLTVAGAFIVGAVLGAVATLRLVRAMLSTLDVELRPRRRRRLRRDVDESTL